MTLKIRAYKNWKKEADDQFSEWAWTQVAKAAIVGIAISIPMFGFGAVTAEKGTNRYDAGLYTTVAGHVFLWSHAGKGIEATWNAIEAIGENN